MPHRLQPADAARPMRGRVPAGVGRLRPWPVRATVVALTCGVVTAWLSGGAPPLDTEAGAGGPDVPATQSLPRTPRPRVEIAGGHSSASDDVAMSGDTPLAWASATVGSTGPGATLAAADVRALPAGPQRTDAIEALVRAWAGRDPAAVAAWIGTLPDPAEQRDALRAAVESTAERDPLRALAMADESGSGRDDGTLERIVRSWAQADLPAARLWLQTARAADAPLAAQVLQVWAVQDPAAAAQAATQLPHGPARARTLSAIAAAWAAQDPGAAAQWAASLPPAEAQAAGQAATQALLNP